MKPMATIPPRHAARPALPLLMMVLPLLALGLLALAAGAASAASPDEAPPVPAGQTRVWFLRLLLPGTAMHPPTIYADGTPIGQSAEGTAFYRDFPPGTHSFTVENCLPQTGTGQTLTLRPNTQVAIEVTSDENGPDFYCVPSQISYLRLVPLQQVPYEFAQVNYAGGS